VVVNLLQLFDHLVRQALTSQRLKEDEDRAEYPRKAPEYQTNAVRSRLWVGNQIEECEAEYQEYDEPLDPCHVELLILPVLHRRLSKTLLHVQAEISMLLAMTQSDDVI
jgi:hypothetical protein